MVKPGDCPWQLQLSSYYYYYMEWIRCTVCEIFAFKLYCDLETGVRGHSRSSKAALFDRAHTTLYSSSIVTASIYYRFRDIAVYIGRKLLPHIWRPRWGWSLQIYATTLGDEKLEWWAYQIVKEFRWHVQPFCQSTRVTDGQTELACGIIRAIAYEVHAITRKTMVQSW